MLSETPSPQADTQTDEASDTREAYQQDLRAAATRWLRATDDERSLAADIRQRRELLKRLDEDLAAKREVTNAARGELLAVAAAVRCVEGAV